jgi:ABC-type multidrug transport system permease subunit
MYQDFDASEFDYLNSTTPQQFEQQNQTQTPEVTDIERFWKITGNWGEFGGYFSTGLAASLIVRAIPVTIPAAVIFFPAISLSVGLYSLSAEGRDKTRCQLILLAIGTALLSANWDAWLAWVIANSQLLIFSFVVTVITVAFVGVQVWSKLSNAGK